MSTDADATPTDQTVLSDQLIAAADGAQNRSQSGPDDVPSSSSTEKTTISQPLQPPQPGAGVIPPSSNSQEKTTIAGPRQVSAGAVLADRWRTDQCLASGGYGDVWKGVDLETQRDIAVKILRTDAGNNDPSAIARMRQEAEILKAIQHKNIVSVYGFGESRYGHFLVMEFLDGQAIDQLLSKEGPVDGERAIPLIAELLEALDEAHSKQILHRDLKPENIIVARDPDGSETAKLVDFGIAKAQRLLDSTEEGATLVQTRAGGFMGTPRYAAPEQAVGDPCGPNIDLFALGLVIAEWLTGRMRMAGDSHGEVMTKLLSPDPIDISDVPYRWREWLSRMLKKNPSERYQSAAEALIALKQLVVDLHQPADFLTDSNSMPFVPAAQENRGFVGEAGAPLELDYAKVRESKANAAVAQAQMQEAMRSSPMRTPHHNSTPPSQPTPAEDHGSSAGNTLFKVVFFISLVLITIAALVLILSELIKRFG